MKSVILTAWLSLLWAILWRDVTLANLAVGVVVALVVQGIFPARRPARPQHTVRPVRLLWLLANFAWQLLVANLIVAREIVTPRDHVRTGILAVPVPASSDLILTILADAITLTPGTLVVEARRSPATLYVHVLHLEDPDRVHRQVLALHRLVVLAFGSRAAVERLTGADTPPDPTPRSEVSS